MVDLAPLEIVSDDVVSDLPPTGFSAVTVDGVVGRLYLSEFEGPVHVMDTGTLEVVASTPMGEGVAATVSDVVVDPAAGVAYVLKGRAGQVDVVHTASFEVVDTIDVGGEPGAGAVDPTTGLLYVTDRLAGILTVLGPAVS